MTAADDGGSGNSVVVPIRVTITAVNEGPPVFSGTFATNLAESAALAASVIDVTAIDPDGTTHEHGNPTYSIISGDTNNQFQINPETGRVSVAAALDRETIASYTLTIEALEEGGTNSATVSATITIDDVDDSPPVCTTQIFSVSVDEDATIPYTVTTLGCTDADSSSTISYTLSSGDGTRFTVTAGTVTMIVAPDFDAGTRQFDLTITVSDDAGTPHTVDVLGTVNILPINEHTPTFTAGKVQEFNICFFTSSLAHCVSLSQGITSVCSITRAINIKI